MDLSIIILNYKSKGDALNCIKSIKESDLGVLKYEIIVVDNGSEDVIGDILSWQYPEIIFIDNKANIGMGAGNNVGLRRATGRYLVIMNPDTLVFENSFQKLFEYLEKNRSAGVVGPKQLNPDKSVQNSCYRWPGVLTPFYRRTLLKKSRLARKELDRYLMADFDHNHEREVDWLLGSFLFCRRTALQAVGFFDERYFLYFEDTDLCREFREKKWEVIYYPKVSIIHNHRRQSAQIAWYKFLTNKATRCHIISWIKYLKKWGFKRPPSIS